MVISASMSPCIPRIATKQVLSTADRRSMYQVIRDWGELTPDAPAILRDEDDALCYRDLLKVVESIGHQLNAVGIGRNDRVAIVHPGGADMAVAILGIWSYATAVPMNPDYTVGEFAVYLRDLGVKAVIVSSGMDTPARAAAKRLDLSLLELSTGKTGATVKIAGKGGAHSAPENPGPAGPDDIATVIVTSGTTGHSKTVPIRHRHLVRRNVFAARQLDLTAEDRGLNLLRLYHSGGLNQGLCLGLVAGGSVGMPQEYSVDGFFRALEAQQSSWCTGVYTFYHAIYCQMADYRPVMKRVAGRLRFMRCGNGRIQSDIAMKLEDAFGVPLLSTYGTSESGAITSEPLPPAPRKRRSVGTKAHENIAILDEAGQKGSGRGGGRGCRLRAHGFRRLRERRCGDGGGVRGGLVPGPATRGISTMTVTCS